MRAPLQKFVYGRFYSSLTRGALSRPERRSILREYNRIFDRAKDVGPRNPLLPAYAMGAYFIAMNRCGNRTPQENYDAIAPAYAKSRIVKWTFGTGERYLDEKKLPARQRWAARTHLHRYENDWELSVLPACADYDLGFDYTRCGICRLCADEGRPELARYLCRLDYIMADMMHLTLVRTKTLSNGDALCDFRFRRPEP